MGLLAVVIASVACLLATTTLLPIMLGVLRRFDVIDVPNQRSSHSSPTPRGGGLACMGGAIVGSAAAFVIDPHTPPVLLLLVTIGLGLLGFADDVWRLDPRTRLLAQLVAGVCAGAALGGYWWLAGGAILIPILVNAVNFMDGINGITSLTMIVWGSAAMLAGLISDAPPLILLGAIAATGGLGFLPWNLPTARAFLGDSGSYFFGGLVAVGLLLAIRSDAPIVVLIMPVFLYLVDTGAVLVRRAVRRVPLFEAHREHIYQRLVATCGLSHAAVAITIAALSVGITAMWAFAWWPVAGIASLLIGLAYLGAVQIVLKLQRSLPGRRLRPR